MRVLVALLGLLLGCAGEAGRRDLPTDAAADSDLDVAVDAPGTAERAGDDLPVLPWPDASWTDSRGDAPADTSLPPPDPPVDAPAPDLTLRDAVADLAWPAPDAAPPDMAPLHDEGPPDPLDGPTATDLPAPWAEPSLDAAADLALGLPDADVASDADVDVVADQATPPLDAAADGPPDANPDTTTNPVVIAAAGDISKCSNDHDEETALLLDSIAPDVVASLGDHAYDDGTAAEFANCYDPTWGRHKDKTRPAVGNHEYHQTGAQPYFDYFGTSAGDPTKGYYSYDLGAWHVVVLNSECWEVGGCGAGDPMETWLRADLAADTHFCTLAYWHRPRWTSQGAHDDEPDMQPSWQALWDAGADLVLSGHNHFYERLGRRDGNGDPHPQGIRSFIVGTGGGSLYNIKKYEPDSEASNDTTYGVLRLTLHPDHYEWEFVPVAGSSYTDSGTDACF